MQFYDYINMTSVILDIIFFSVLMNLMLIIRGDFTLPIEEQDEFDILVEYSANTKIMIRIMVLAILFRVLQAFSIIRHSFPSFTILFETMIGAKKDLLYFFAITFLLLFAYAIAGQTSFGTQ